MANNNNNNSNVSPNVISEENVPLFAGFDDDEEDEGIACETLGPFPADGIPEEGGHFYFNFTITNDYEYSSLKRVAGQMYKVRDNDGDDEKIGRLDAVLVNRDGRGGFFEVCDSVSDELQRAAVLFCDDNGKVRQPLRGIMGNRTRVGHASVGGFLDILEVHIQPGHRGKSLGLHFTLALLSHLGSRWTLACLWPFPMKGYGFTGPEQGRDINGLKSVCRHFARLNFKQMPECSPFWWLDRPSLPTAVKPRGRKASGASDGAGAGAGAGGVTVGRKRKADEVNQVKEEEGEEYEVEVEVEQERVLPTGVHLELFEAAMAGNLPEVKRLCESGINVNEARALFPAVGNRNLAMAQYLIHTDNDTEWWKHTADQVYGTASTCC